MKTDDINHTKVPMVQTDGSLDKFAKKVLFPEKLKLANRLLKNVMLPKQAKAR